MAFHTLIVPVSGFGLHHGHWHVSWERVFFNIFRVGSVSWVYFICVFILYGVYLSSFILLNTKVQCSLVCLIKKCIEKVFFFCVMNIVRNHWFIYLRHRCKRLTDIILKWLQTENSERPSGGVSILLSCWFLGWFGRRGTIGYSKTLSSGRRS